MHAYISLAHSPVNPIVMASINCISAHEVRESCLATPAQIYRTVNTVELVLCSTCMHVLSTGTPCSQHRFPPAQPHACFFIPSSSCCEPCSSKHGSRRCPGCSCANAIMRASVIYIHRRVQYSYRSECEEIYAIRDENSCPRNNTCSTSIQPRPQCPRP